MQPNLGYSFKCVRLYRKLNWLVAAGLAEVKVLARLCLVNAQLLDSVRIEQ